MENKFAPIPMTIPLISDIEVSVKQIHKVTSALKNAFGEVYSTYATSFYTGLLSPYFLSNWFIN